ncbi:MAG TPA: ATP-binding protein, partial [Verrucomicrobiae bacterium]|nr:ATP-binding protein [Verrucomicrobiae bacterium]
HADQLLYLFARDITDRRRNEREINKLNADLAQRADELLRANVELEAEIVTRQRAEEALQESNSALEAFSYSVSHDLRAPIRAMQGFANVLLEDYGTALEEMGRECATRIVNAAERMDTLVHDLLIYSRLGHTTLDLSPVSVRDAVREALTQLEEDLRSRDAKVIVQEPLPNVLGHPTTFIQVLANLISNGTKFVPPGVKPVVKVSAETEGEFVTVSVQDNGIGIAAENQGRIFRVFERLHGADDYPGTGLGLAIVRKGIDRMGGQVGLESVVGEGSRFWIKLSLSPGGPLHK